MDLMTGHSPFAAPLPVLRFVNIDNNTQRLTACTGSKPGDSSFSRTYIQKLELTS